MLAKKISILLIISLLAGCANGQITKQNAGVGIGAVAGGLLGSTLGKGDGRLVTTALGAVIGAAAGNAIGASLDRADQAYYERSASSTFESTPTGHSGGWKNPDNGHSGTFIPTKTYQNHDGSHCREFTQKINIGGQVKEGYGTACRQADGSWKIVS